MSGRGRVLLIVGILTACVALLTMVTYLRCGSVLPRRILATAVGWMDEEVLMSLDYNFESRDDSNSLRRRGWTAVHPSQSRHESNVACAIYINVASNYARNRAMVAFITSLELPWRVHRMNAVTPSSPQIPELSAAFTTKRVITRGLGEIACLGSHIKAWRLAADVADDRVMACDSDDWMVIFEDDVCVNMTLAATTPSHRVGQWLTRTLHTAPTCVDVLLFGCRMPVPRDARNDEERAAVMCLSSCAGKLNVAPMHAWFGVEAYAFRIRHAHTLVAYVSQRMAQKSLTIADVLFLNSTHACNMAVFGFITPNHATDVPAFLPAVLKYMQGKSVFSCGLITVRDDSNAHSAIDGT